MKLLLLGFLYVLPLLCLADKEKECCEFIGLPVGAESWYGAQRVSFSVRVKKKQNEGRFWDVSALTVRLDNPYHRSRKFYNVIITPPTGNFRDSDGFFKIEANVPTVRVRSKHYYVKIDQKYNDGVFWNTIAESKKFRVQPAYLAPLPVSDPNYGRNTTAPGEDGTSSGEKDGSEESDYDVVDLGEENGKPINITIIQDPFS